MYRGTTPTRERVALTALTLLALLLTGGCTLGPLNPDDNSSDTGVTAAALSNPTGTAAVHVSWTPPRDIPLTQTARAGYVVGYEVFRATSPAVQPVATQMVAFLEGGSSRVYVDDVAGAGSSELVTLTTDADTGLVQVAREAGSGTPAITQATDTITYDYNSTPPVAGQDYYYLVRVVSKKLGATPFDPVDGTPDLSGQLVVSQSYPSRQVTLLASTVLVSPPNYPDPGSLDVDLPNALFSWDPAIGADSYCIELCTDRTFPAQQIVRSTEYHVAAGTTTAISRTFAGADLSAAFGSWTGPIYWRVGARRSTNAADPVDVTGKRVGYVYSDYRSLEAIESPPSGP